MSLTTHSGARPWAMAALAAMVAAAGMAGCGATGGGRREGDTAGPMPAAKADLADARFETLWTTNIRVYPETRLDELWLVGPYLVGRGTDKRLYLSDASTGVRRWERQLAEPFQSVHRPAYFGPRDELWVPTTTHLVGLKAAEGLDIEREPLRFMPAGGATTNGVHVFMPEVRGYLKAVAIGDDFYDWDRWTSGVVTTRPVLYESLVFWASHSGEIFGSAQQMRRIVWQYTAEDACRGDLKVSEAGNLIVPSLDYSIYAFRAASGALQWQYPAGEPVSKAVYAHDGQVYAFTETVGCHCLDETTGQLQWDLKEGADFVAGEEDVVYLRSRDGDLLVVRREDGTVAARVPLAEGTLVAVNETGDGRVYLTTPDGSMLAAARMKEPEVPGQW